MAAEYVAAEYRVVAPQRKERMRMSGVASDRQAANSYLSTFSCEFRPLVGSAYRSFLGSFAPIINFELLFVVIA